MPITHACTCGATYSLKDEFAGTEVKCPKCGAVSRAPELRRAAQADPAFERDKYLLRQKVLAISEKYDLCDEEGRPILFVVRPARFLRKLLAVFAAAFVLIVGITVIFVAMGGGDRRSGGSPGDLEGGRALLFIVGFVVVIAATVAVGYWLAPKRHVTVGRDSSMNDVVLRVEQLNKFHFPYARFAIRSADGAILARLTKNSFSDILRKKWRCTDAAGRPIFVAREDSAILSLLRRLLGPLFGALRTNFIFLEGDGTSERVIGEFNRKFTLFDRYVLDLTADPERRLDRRLAVAVGVMLDSGEKR